MISYLFHKPHKCMYVPVLSSMSVTCYLILQVRTLHLSPQTFDRNSNSKEIRSSRKIKRDTTQHSVLIEPLSPYDSCSPTNQCSSSVITRNSNSVNWKKKCHEGLKQPEQPSTRTYQSQLEICNVCE
jgi:nitrogen regulatory protein PII-like uncharacterized protein